MMSDLHSMAALESSPFALKRRTSSPWKDVRVDAPSTASCLKKLKRMPHLFARVLELPFHADTAVEVQEMRDCFMFKVRHPGLVAEEVRAEVMEIVPGATKVVIGGGELEALEVDLWRFRLPPSTLPEGSVASYENEVLNVIVPKRPVSCGVVESIHETGESDGIVSEGDGEIVLGAGTDTSKDSIESAQEIPESQSAIPSSVVEELGDLPDTCVRREDLEKKRDGLQVQPNEMLGGIVGVRNDVDKERALRRLHRDAYGGPTSCGKASVEHVAGNPELFRSIGSWVHGFAIFV